MDRQSSYFMRIECFLNFAVVISFKDGDILLCYDYVI